MNKIIVSSVTLLALSVANSLQAQTSSNDESVERITVYSSFRDTNLDQLDASASIISSGLIKARQSSHIEDILNIAPNVNFNTGASRGRFVQIRGIGERSQFAEPINPSVSILVDGFDFSGLGAAGLTFDTEQVEVFRGPQATLFGGGALAGAIRIQSASLTANNEGFVDVKVGSESALRLEAAYGGSISDSARYRVAVLQNQADGFVENTFLQRDDTNNLDEFAAKAHFEFDISQNTQLTLRTHWYDIDNGYDAFSLDNDNMTLSDEPGYDRQETAALGLELQHQTRAGDWLVSVTTASHDIDYAYDEDWTFDGFHPFGYTSFDRYIRELSTQTAEVRFVANDANRLFNDTTSWVVGAYAKQTEEDFVREYTYNAEDFTSQYEPSTIALYGQLNTDLGNNWALETGLRAERFAFDYSHNDGLDTDTSTSVVGGKVSLSYTLPEHFLYASISRGYKAAGVNPDQQVSEEQRFFDTEYNWNYELGGKSFWADTGINTRVALFHMRRKNTQVSDFDTQLRDDGSTDFIDIIDNADLGTNQGVEFEMNWQATDNWLVTANLGYLNASFEDFVQANGDVVEKKQQAQAPKWTSHVSSSYAFSDALTWYLNWDFKDDYRFSDGHDETSGTTALVNTEVAYQLDAVTLTLWGKNLFDRTYYTRGFGGFSNDPRDEYAFVEPYFQLGNGRQVGVSVRYQFD